VSYLRKRKPVEPIGIDGEPIQSRDFAPHYSTVFRETLLNRTRSIVRNQTISRWLLTFLVGASTALCGAFVAICTQSIASWKFDFIEDTLQQGHHGLSYLYLVGINCGLVFIAFCYVYGNQQLLGLVWQR